MKNCILRGYICWFISLVYTVFVCNSLKAETHTVPDDFSTIQQALNSSNNLDTVRVRPGMYAERIIFPSTNIKLLSDFMFTDDSTDLFSTVIDASNFSNLDTSAVVSFVNGNTQQAQLSGFVLRGGHGTLSVRFNEKIGGGIYVYNTSPTISQNIITEDSAFVGALYCDNSYPIFSHNSIYNNWAGNEFLCLFNGDQNHPIIFEWNEIGQNYTDGACVIEVDYCLGFFRYNSFHDINIPVNWLVTILLSDLDFIGNSFERVTGNSSFVSMVVLDYMVGLIQDNVFGDCLIPNGYALTLERFNFSYPQEVNRNLFENLGAGLLISHPAVYIHDNTFASCNGNGGAALFLTMGEEGCSVNITRNIFLDNHNSSPVGTGGIEITPYEFVRAGRMCTVTGNWFEGNTPKAITQQIGDSLWDIPNNYWGDASGPYHPIENPNGLGDTVDVSCHVTPWLTEPPALDANPQSRSEPIPESWTLEKIYPNPFNSSVNIKLSSPTTVSLQVTIYDITGRRVKDLWQGVVPARGNVALSWDARGDSGPVSSGVYLITAYSQKNSARVQTQKAVLLK